jgi:predicted double-glycine peptidase
VLTHKQHVISGALAVLLYAATAVSAAGLWLDVPYIHQERDGCGSASLAMILRYWQGKDFAISEESADPARIQRELYAAKPHGIFAVDMERYLRGCGFDVYAFRGDWGDVRSHLAKGRPLIAGLKPKNGPAHYVVIAGVEPGDTAVLLNDPERGKLVHVERTEFEKAWQGTRNWTLLAVPHHVK